MHRADRQADGKLSIGSNITDSNLGLGNAETTRGLTRHLYCLQAGYGVGSSLEAPGLYGGAYLIAVIGKVFGEEGGDREFFQEFGVAGAKKSLNI